MKTKATPKTSTVKTTNSRSKKSTTQKPFVKAAADVSNGAEKHTLNTQLLSEKIAARAYQIWQQQGCPEGREEQHWRQAEREVARDGSGSFMP